MWKRINPSFKPELFEIRFRIFQYFWRSMDPLSTRTWYILFIAQLLSQNVFFFITIFMFFSLIKDINVIYLIHCTNTVPKCFFFHYNIHVFFSLMKDINVIYLIHSTITVSKCFFYYKMHVFFSLIKDINQNNFLKQFIVFGNIFVPSICIM